LAYAHSAYAADLTAAEVMAAYLRHIAVLTEWPRGSAANSTDPLVIGVVGEDPNGVISPIRERITAGEELLAQNRPIRVIKVQIPAHGEADPAALSSCALLFVSAGAEDEWERIRPAVNSLPIVTVSELNGFTGEGGIVEYFIERRTGKVRMKVSLSAMRRAGVVLSARFLALQAVIVLDREDA
jgi:hypothetical protein